MSPEKSEQTIFRGHSILNGIIISCLQRASPVQFYLPSAFFSYRQKPSVKENPT